MTNVTQKSGLIKKPFELKVQTSIKTLLYGQPGIGKTTLALSAPSPLLVDFDNGVHRVDPMHQSDTVQVESWQSMLDLLNNEDLTSYKTLIIDTAGKMLDYLGNYLIEKNPKLGKTNGALSLQGYGERKAEFSAFLKRVSLMGKHLVFLAHEKEEKEGDNKIIRPEIGGSSGSDLIKELDLVGYMEAIGKKRTVSFNPCEKFYGKNTCKLPDVIEITDVVTPGIGKTIPSPNILLSSIFDTYQKSLAERKEVAAKYNQLLEQMSNEINAIENAEQANNISTEIANYDAHVWDSKLQGALMIKERTEILGLKFNRTLKKYEQPVEPKKEETTPPATTVATTTDAINSNEFTEEEKAEIAKEEQQLAQQQSADLFSKPANTSTNTSKAKKDATVKA